jgi:hypothetical protein
VIDEKRLDEIIQIHWDGLPPNICIRKGELSELIRLARLGLWAEKHGIPAIKLTDENLWFDPVERGACMGCEANLHDNCIGKHMQLDGDPCHIQIAHEALAALPKDEK